MPKTDEKTKTATSLPDRAPRQHPLAPRTRAARSPEDRGLTAKAKTEIALGTFKGVSGVKREEVLAREAAEKEAERPRGMEDGGPHLQGAKDLGCAVCISEFLPMIEKFYVDGATKDEMELFDVEARIVNMHARALGLHDKRADNTDAVRRIMTEAGVEAIRNGEVTVKPETLERINRNRDEKMGRAGIKETVNTTIRIVLPQSEVAARLLPGGGLPRLGPAIDAEYEESNK